MVPRWVIVTSAAVVLSTCAPTAYLALTTPADQHFTGNWEYVHDQSTYLMWAAQVRDGHLLVRDLHTSEPHPPLLPSLPWLVVGLVARWLHLPLLWAYHGLRVVSGFAYLLLAWGVVREYFGERGPWNREEGIGNREEGIGNRERQTADGERQTADGERQTADGERQTADGERQTADGERQTADGERQTADGERQTADGERQRHGDCRAGMPDLRLTAKAMIVAFLCIAVGSGLKVVAHLVNYLVGRRVASTAEWMPETWGFHSIAVMPHFALALALLAALVWVLLVCYRRPSWGLLVAAPVLMTLLTLVHPFDVAVLGPLLVAHFAACRLWAAPRRWAWADLTALAGVVPPAVFFLWQTRTNPILAAWAAQNVLPSPPMLSYLLGFGAVLVPAASGLLIMRHRSRRSCADWLVILWLAVTVVMINAGPVVSFERRCIEGAHIPLSLLAGIGMVGWLLPWLRERWGLSEARAWRIGLAALLVCILPSNLKLLRDGFVSDQALIPADWVSGYEWLATHSAPDECVLTSPVVGNHLAPMALRPVYVGHTQQTIDFGRKTAEMDEFFSTATPVARREEILRSSGCRWVMAHDRQRLAADELPGLERVYLNDTVSIYRPATPGRP